MIVPVDLKLSMPGTVSLVAKSITVSHIMSCYTIILGNLRTTESVRRPEGKLLGRLKEILSDEGEVSGDGQSVQQKHRQRLSSVALEQRCGSPVDTAGIQTHGNPLGRP